MHHLHVLCYIFEASAECHRSAHEQALDHCAGALICMMYRKYAEEDIAWAYFEVSLRDEYISAEVPV